MTRNYDLYRLCELGKAYVYLKDAATGLMNAQHIMFMHDMDCALLDHAIDVIEDQIDVCVEEFNKTRTKLEEYRCGRTPTTTSNTERTPPETPSFRTGSRCSGQA